MALYVPGVGDVPITWLPASDEDFKDASEGARSGFAIKAIVNHRGVVNSLHSLDVTFAAGDTDPATVGAKGRAVSATFGIGGKAGIPQISQYVNVSDTAYCNGDCQQYPKPGTTTPGLPSRWDSWYGHRGHNEATVSIEYDDNGGLAAGDPRRGIVDEAFQLIGMHLIALLLTGDIAKIRAAGIRIREQATADQLKAIVPGPRTLIDHNDIAGSKKPSCWRPWAADTVGFPRRRYIDTVTALLAPPPVPAPVTYTQAQLDAAVAAATEPLKGQIATLAGAAGAASTRIDEAIASLEAAKSIL